MACGSGARAAQCPPPAVLPRPALPLHGRHSPRARPLHGRATPPRPAPTARRAAPRQPAASATTARPAGN